MKQLNRSRASACASVRAHAPCARGVGCARAPSQACRAIVQDYRPTTADTATTHLQDDNWKRKAATSRLVVIPPSRNPSLPNLNAVVVVEGSRDVLVVRRAVNAPIICIGGTHKGFGKESLRRVREVIELVPALIVLVDPDMYGRQYRNAVTQAASKATWHAFLPAACAVATTYTRYHQPGNVGVEHAHPRHVQQALRNCQRSQVDSPDTFNKELLVQMGLVQPAHNTCDHERIQHAALRRELLCNILGLAKADGKQLLVQLNRYGFQGKQVAEALRLAEARLPHVLAFYEALKAAEHTAFDGGPSADILAYAVTNAVRSALATGAVQCDMPAALAHAHDLLTEWGYVADAGAIAALAPLLQPTVLKAASRGAVDSRRGGKQRRRPAHTLPDVGVQGKMVRSRHARYGPHSATETAVQLHRRREGRRKGSADGGAKHGTGQSWPSPRLPVP